MVSNNKISWKLFPSNSLIIYVHVKHQAPFVVSVFAEARCFQISYFTFFWQNGLREAFLKKIPSNL